MAKAKGLYAKIAHEPIFHKTSIGRNPSLCKMNKHKRRQFKKYHGQGRQGVDNNPFISYIYRMKGKIMKKTKTDSVREFQKQAVDQRVCLFYVADRVKGILEDSKTEEQLRDNLEEFKDECVHNIGTNALIERYEY